MRQTGPGLASVVVKLHQAEDQVCRYEFKLVGGIGDDVPFCTLAGGAEVGISQPVNSKTKHVICFQSFAEQITITTTIP